MTVAIERPKYQTLKLVAANGKEYTMTPVPGKEYEYKAREAFPLDMEASIVAPAYSDGTGNPYLQGNELKFGMDNGKLSSMPPRILALKTQVTVKTASMKSHSIP